MYTRGFGELVSDQDAAAAAALIASGQVLTEPILTASADPTYAGVGVSSSPLAGISVWALGIGAIAALWFFNSRGQ